MALDRDKRQVGTIGSNAGHCLWSGIVTPEQLGRREAAAGKQGMELFLGKRVEDPRRGLRIRTVVKGKSDDFFAIAGNTAQRATEKRTVAIKSPVHRAAQYRCSNGGVPDHWRRPSTAV